MTARSSRPDPPTPRPLSNWTIAAGALVVLAVAVVVVAVSWFVLRRLYGGQGAQVQLDVIRTAGTLVIGTGGAVALLLTARRQRYTELALVHTDRDATVVRSSVGAPPVAAPDPELFVTEIEPPQGIFDFGNPEERHRAAEELKSYRISQGKMIRRS